MEYRAISLSDVVAGAMALFRENRSYLIGGVLALGFMNYVSDRFGGTSLSVAMFFGQVFLQCLTTAKLFDNYDPVIASRQYRGLAIASILSGIAIGFGMLLLIVPGVVLMARWYLVTPLIVRNEMAVGEALRTSWAATKPSQGTFLLLSCGYLGVLAAILVGGMLVVRGLGVSPGTLYVSLPINLLVCATIVAGWVTAVASANAVEVSGARLRTVFA
ncbi:hypothetical protein [Novosphingobium sp. JCM 18896]|uniref:hypothetical protein n=1 Tax=Novosphingobium sp. JCM 18896 TaxID=2989731 RepID=UPI002221F4D4|nr:hypothetical protein [Novosphingobium sp. JCM 18896]MCW1428613.1 hypothetical protein [Novosphingobium sp. JCM 18896]